MRRRLPVSLLAALVLGGCAGQLSTDRIMGVFTPYRIDIVQGNVVTKEQMALVRNGMTRTQVRDILGSPLLTDPFHVDRWDYIFTIRRPGTPVQRRSIIILFQGDAVASIDAPDLPSEREFVASISRQGTPKVPRLELSDEERGKLPPPPKPEAPAVAPPEPTGPVRDYPPLESS
jgi:outer membrane protein assembly factor BamE